ncbi:MAG TPA: polysaccharide biosynthesis/export family protein [Usitatibacter sp.]|nr:polysaccharide biosynthesis/export family protein [Usitatibacter sp.]
MRNAVVALAVAFCGLLATHDAAAEEGLRLSLSLSALPATVEAANSSALPMPVALARPAQVPSGNKDYRIGSEDLLEIQVFGVDQLSRTVRVNSRGQVSLPLIGVVDVAGLTAQEAEASISRKLAESYLQNPQVSLFIKEFTTQRVTIEGAVNRPGIYPLRGQTTLLTSLALAGGQAALSDMSEVMLFRADASGKRVSSTFDVEKIRRGELEDPVVVNDDLIVVNRSKSRTALRDSLFRDVIDTVNPLRWAQPIP